MRCHAWLGFGLGGGFGFNERMHGMLLRGPLYDLSRQAGRRRTVRLTTHSHTHTHSRVPSRSRGGRRRLRGGPAPGARILLLVHPAKLLGRHPRRAGGGPAGPLGCASRACLPMAPVLGRGQAGGRACVACGASRLAIGTPACTPSPLLKPRLHPHSSACRLRQDDAAVHDCRVGQRSGRLCQRGRRRGGGRAPPAQEPRGVRAAERRAHPLAHRGRVPAVLGAAASAARHHSAGPAGVPCLPAGLPAWLDAMPGGL